MFLTIAIKTVWLDGDFVGQERYDPSRRKPIDFSRGMNAAAETCRI